MFADLISGKWLSGNAAKVANLAKEEVSLPSHSPELAGLAGLAKFASSSASETESSEAASTPRLTHQTTMATCFNDPSRGATFEIPAGTPCSLISSVAWAYIQGWLPDDDTRWTKEQQHKGNVLVWLAGQVRALPPDYIKLLPCGGSSEDSLPK